MNYAILKTLDRLRQEEYWISWAKDMEVHCTQGVFLNIGCGCVCIVSCAFYSIHIKSNH